MSKKWTDLSQRTRKVIVMAAAAETVLKVAVLVDLRRRSPAEVRGSRRIWAMSMIVNSFGVVPVAYFAVGRRPHGYGDG